MTFPEFEVSSLGELIDRLASSDPDRKTGHRRDSCVFRGTGDPEWPFLTSLDRLGGTDPPHTKADLEEQILRNFIRYSRPHFRVFPANEWELLVAAQHHGLPTRLLDWTHSPLVAAHFATLAHDSDGDRVIWRLNWKIVHEAFGFPELPLLIQDLISCFDRDESFTPWSLFSGRHLPRDFACLIDPPSLDGRIVEQAAAFTLCSDKRQPFDLFLARHGFAGALTKMILPAEKVQTFRDQLDLVGISERRLYPDLDGVAAETRRHFS